MTFSEALAIDNRSLALFRIAIGCVVLLSLGFVAKDAELFLSDDGLEPRSWIREYMQHEAWLPSIYMLTGDASVSLVLLAVHAFVTVLFIVGWFTDYTKVILWYLCISLQNRTALLTYGADVVLRTLLFFSLFLPVGTYCSVDALVRREREGKRPSVRHYSTRSDGQLVLNGATVAFILQCMFVWMIGGIRKATGNSSMWYPTCDATFMALQIDYLRLEPLGSVLLSLGPLLRPLCSLVLTLELFTPLLLVSPVYSNTLRTVGVCVLLCLVLSFGLTLKVGLFPHVMCAGLLGLVPWSVWHKQNKSLEQEQSKLRLEIASSAPPALSLLLRNAFSSAVHVEIDPIRKIHSRHWQLSISGEPMSRSSDSLSTLLRVSYMDAPLASPFVYVFTHLTSALPCTIVDLLLNCTAWWLGLFVYSRTALSVRRTRSGFTSHRVVSLFVSVCMFVWQTLIPISMIAIVFGFMIRDLTPPALEPLIHMFRLDQRWLMFAPSPPTSNSYYVVKLDLADGNAVDVWRDEGMFHFEGRPLPSNWKEEQTYDSAANVVNDMGSSHLFWRVYELLGSDCSDLRICEQLASYVCRRWNHEHIDVPSEYATYVEIHEFKQRTHSRANTEQPLVRAPWRRTLKWEMNCA